MNLTDDQYLYLEPLLPSPRAGPGRPPGHARPHLDGVFWKLRTASPWYLLPASYPPWPTCYQRFATWQRSGLLDRAAAALCRHLRHRGGLDLAPYLPIGALAFLRFGFTGRLQLDPVWERTWQLSTALLLFSFLAHKARRQVHPYLGEGGMGGEGDGGAILPKIHYNKSHIPIPWNQGPATARRGAAPG